MKIEAGQHYKARCGNKAIVAWVGNGPDGREVAIGWFVGERSLNPRVWAMDGKIACKDSPVDLVAEWREPATKTVDLALCRNKDGFVDAWFTTHPRPGTIGHRRITLTEGEFDDPAFRPKEGP